MKAEGMGATEIAKTLKIGRASVYAGGRIDPTMKSSQAKSIVVPDSIAFVLDVGTVELGELGPGAASGLTLIAREKPPCTGHYPVEAVAAGL